MKITFGKYAGSTVKEVAIVDAEYASWAANNLKNPAMRNAFAQALVDAQSATAEEIAAAEVDPSDSRYAVVLEMVKADKVEEAEAARREQERAAKVSDILADWSAESGQPVAKLKSVADRCAHDFEFAPANMFSSRTAHQMFLKYMRQIDILWR